jgi:hypothetical protein
MNPFSTELVKAFAFRGGSALNYSWDLVWLTLNAFHRLLMERFRATRLAEIFT